MAQSQIDAAKIDNTGGFQSVHWDPHNCNVKCKVNKFCSIKVEKKDSTIYLVVQEGSSRIRLAKETFDNLYELRESILFLMSFVESNS